MTSDGVCGVFIPARVMAGKNMKDTSEWYSPTNERLLNTVSIVTTSSDYKTLNSCLQKAATWIVSTEKPSKFVQGVSTTYAEISYSFWS